MWNLISGNKICALKKTTEVIIYKQSIHHLYYLSTSQFINSQNQQRHLNNIKKVKPAIDCNQPWRAQKPHQKDIKFKKNRNMQIFKDNQVLLNKMTMIEQKDSNLHPKAISKTHFDQKSLGMAKRIKECTNINTQNKFMLKRLQSAKSEYSKQGWIKNIRHINDIKKNLKIGQRPRQVDYNVQVEKLECTGMQRPQLLQRDTLSQSNTKARLYNSPSAKQTINIHYREHLEFDMFNKNGLRPLTAPKQTRI